MQCKKNHVMNDAQLAMFLPLVVLWKEETHIFWVFPFEIATPLSPQLDWVAASSEIKPVKVALKAVPCRFVLQRSTKWSRKRTIWPKILKVEVLRSQRSQTQVCQPAVTESKCVVCLMKTCVLPRFLFVSGWLSGGDWTPAVAICYISCKIISHQHHVDNFSSHERKRHKQTLWCATIADRCAVTAGDFCCKFLEWMVFAGCFGHWSCLVRDCSPCSQKEMATIHMDGWAKNVNLSLTTPTKDTNKLWQKSFSGMEWLLPSQWKWQWPSVNC